MIYRQCWPLSTTLVVVVVVWRRSRRRWKGLDEEERLASALLQAAAAAGWRRASTSASAHMLIRARNSAHSTKTRESRAQTSAVCSGDLCARLSRHRYLPAKLISLNSPTINDIQIDSYKLINDGSLESERERVSRMSRVMSAKELPLAAKLESSGGNGRRDEPGQ